MPFSSADDSISSCLHVRTWTMHELVVHQEEGWVVCRVFIKKRVEAVRRMPDGAPPWFDGHVPGGFMAPAGLGSPRQLMHHHPNPAAAAALLYSGQQLYHCKPELEYHHLLQPSQEALLQQLPQLMESPKPPPPPAFIDHGSCSLQSPDDASGYNTTPQQPPPMTTEAAYMDDDSVTDWRVLDKFVASQLFSHGDGMAKEDGYPNPGQALFQAENKQPEEALDYASTSASGGGGGEANMWK
jgi:hypothetical protein